VSDQATLQAIGAELARDRAVVEDADGRLRAVGPTGFGLAFEVTTAARETAPPPPRPRAPNGRVAGYRRAVPDHLGHMGVYTDAMDEMAAFYIDRLGFTQSDEIAGFGRFLRAPGSINHHNLLVAKRPRPGMQHLSLRVRDIDELGAGIRYMEARGWKRVWGPGRHGPGSDMFVFFANPAGALLEYHCDEDFITDVAQWSPKVWDPKAISLWGDRPPAEMGAPPALSSTAAADLVSTRIA
jgi:catechol 2,3-dioxygenase-like lactoylglutathione lyase family enzyme